MDESLFTVYFEDPYWIGIIEQTVEGSYSAARIVFGSEPTDAQILAFLAENYPNNLRFTENLKIKQAKGKSHANPKRRQREAARLLSEKGGSTKAQEALQQSYENYKQEKQQEQKHLKEENNKRKFQQKTEKRKLKKRGR